MRKKIMQDAYNRCIKSEFDLEKIIMRKNGLDSFFSFVIPKSIKFKNLIKNKFIWEVFFYILSKLWWIIIFPSIEIFKLIKFIILKIGTKKRKDNIKGNILLGISPRIYDLEKKIAIDIDYRIDFYFINKYKIKNDSKAVDFFSLISFTDIFEAFMYSLTKSRKSIKKDYDLTAKLLTYSSFEWFLVYSVLDRELKLCDKIYFCNQYDRWIHLIDSIDTQADRVLVQHGVVIPFELTEIKNISKIYCFNHEQREIFENYIYVNCKNIEFEVIPLSIKLEENNDVQNSMLIIGQPYSVEKEIKIIEKLLLRSDKINIMLKPHPVFGDTLYKDVQNKVNIIRDRNFYPNVKLALAYESTLGLEYEASGVKVIWIKNESVDNIVDNVIDFINNRHI